MYVIYHCFLLNATHIQSLGTMLVSEEVTEYIYIFVFLHTLWISTNDIVRVNFIKVLYIIYIYILILTCEFFIRTCLHSAGVAASSAHSEHVRAARATSRMPKYWKIWKYIYIYASYDIIHVIFFLNTLLTCYLDFE